mmetsp:Transcript_111525/g.238242  ORF Transcript_111525/g.238242 Transcript_111525/m.238242 type:complete len:286 (+) Transcript_111525:436-1293(+)
MRPAASSVFAKRSSMAAIAGMIICSWRFFRSSWPSPKLSATCANAPTRPSRPPPGVPSPVRRLARSVCFSLSALICVAFSTILASCFSDCALLISTVSSCKAFSFADCCMSVCDTRTSNLSNLARTSLTSSKSAFAFNAFSTIEASAFFANSPFKASRCPMKTDSAMVSMYCRSSDNFFSTVLCSDQFTLFEIFTWRSWTSSRFENIVRHFRLESWNASSRRCSNSWKAMPIARRRSVSEIIAFMPLSRFETTSCCCRVVRCNLSMPCSSCNTLFLLRLCSAIGS